MFNSSPDANCLFSMTSIYIVTNTELELECLGLKLAFSILSFWESCSSLCVCFLICKVKTVLASELCYVC